MNKLRFLPGGVLLFALFLWLLPLGLIEECRVTGPEWCEAGDSDCYGYDVQCASKAVLGLPGENAVVAEGNLATAFMGWMLMGCILLVGAAICFAFALQPASSGKRKSPDDET
jgi:hypothetical protein